MEAARIAALRGHRVTIFEKSQELGGAILLCCTVHGKNKMRWYADWIRRQVAAAGIEVRYASVPAPDELRGFDAVLVATGGSVVRPGIPGIESPCVCTFEDVLRCAMTKCEFYPKDGKPAPVETGETVLIWGDHFGAVDAAEKLGVDGKKVYIVTENREFASWLEPCNKDVMDKRFKGGNGEGLTGRTFTHPVTIIPRSTILSIAPDGELTIVDASLRRSTLKVDTVVCASVAADDSLYRAYLAAGLTAVRIGDVKKVRNLRGAVTDGATAGLTLDRDLRLNANSAVIASFPADVRA